MLKLAKNLELPIAAVTQTFAFLGKRGGGKTYGAGKLAEEMLLIGAQIVVLDVVGTWFGLRVPKKAKEKAFDILVFGGDHGDVEINPKAGKIVANIILDRNLSAVIDLSQFIHSEQTRFTYDFMIAFFEGRKKNRAACHIFIEEAQELVPQNLPAGSDNFAGKMLHAGERVVKLGHNFGIGCSLISQRPQEVNKKVLNQTEVLLAFQMTGLQERKTIGDWVRDKGDDTNVQELLPKLVTGEALIWSPTWLRISGTYKISEKRTADVSATPEVGVEPVNTQKLAPVDVVELKEAIASLTEEMDANTPTALKKQISELQKELRAARLEGNSAPVKPVEIEVIKEVPVFPEETADAINISLTRIKTRMGVVAEMQRDVDDIRKAVTSVIARPAASNERPKQATPQKPGDNMTRDIPLAIRVTNVSSSAQKILDALALCEKIGLVNPERINVAYFAGYTVNGHFNNMVGNLRTAGLVDYPSGGRLCLTGDGRTAANANGIAINSLADLHNVVRSKLSAPEGKILDALIEYKTEPIARDLLAEKTGYTVNGHFNNMVGHLKTLGLAHYPMGGHVAATSVLFPEGLS